jgi:hypothetical protein
LRILCRLNAKIPDSQDAWTVVAASTDQPCDECRTHTAGDEHVTVLEHGDVARAREGRITVDFRKIDPGGASVTEELVERPLRPQSRNYEARLPCAFRRVVENDDDRSVIGVDSDIRRHVQGGVGKRLGDKRRVNGATCIHAKDERASIRGTGYH